MNNEEFPSNSHKAKENTKPVSAEQQPEKKVEKLVTGKVRKAKKGLWASFLSLFFAEDVTDAKSHIARNIIIPAVKETVLEAFSYFLTGETRDRRKTPKGYTNYSGSYREREERDRREKERYSARDIYEVDDIILETYGEADLVLDELTHLIDRYGMATVADLYDAIGVTAQHTDYKYGWTSLRTATIVRVRDGYLLKLPRTMALER